MDRTNIKQKYEVVSNRKLSSDLYEMTLSGDTSMIAKPGQFINITIPNHFLKRPISIADWDDEKMVIIYRIAGKGTKWLSLLTSGDKLECLSGLGNGFTVENNRRLIIGGGAGVPPLYGLAKRVVTAGIKPIFILGFRNADEIFYLAEFKALSDEVYVATDDGSFGQKGTVCDLLTVRGLTDIPYYACGPLAMLKSVCHISQTNGQLSLEERMGCGFGACMGCSIKTKNGPKRICKEGPVLSSEELLWDVI